MEKDNTEAEVIQQEKRYAAKMYCQLLRKKNGISSWKEKEEIKNNSEAKQNDPQSSEEENGSSSPLATRVLSSSREDSTEDFTTELTFFNDLVITTDPGPHMEYVPYYRTYTNLVEIPLCINSDEQEENTEKEDSLQNNGCALKFQYEDEPLHDLDHFSTGYFPFYRTCEEYFCSADLSSDEYRTAEIEVTVVNNANETESETDCETGTLYEEEDFQENYEKWEDTSWRLKSPVSSGTHHLFTDYCNEPNDSNELLNTNQVAFCSECFPY